jgi:hypothetical protein
MLTKPLQKNPAKKEKKKNPDLCHKQEEWIGRTASERAI